MALNKQKYKVKFQEDAKQADDKVSEQATELEYENLILLKQQKKQLILLNLPKNGMELQEVFSLVQSGCEEGARSKVRCNELGVLVGQTRHVL